MTKFDLYRTVHKGQRARLFALAADCGRADFTDPEQANAVRARIKAIVAELHEHAEHENKLIHPMLRREAPSIAERLEAEHANLDPLLDRLAAQADATSGDGIELYRTLCSMISIYLAHIHYEETVAMPALWESCSNDEIIGAKAAFLASRTQQQTLIDLRGQISAISPQERAAMLNGIASGNPQIFNQLLNALAVTIPA